MQGDQALIPHRLSERDFSRLAAIVRAGSGVLLPPSKRALAEGRLAKRMRALGIADYADYCLRADQDAGERQLMIEALTTNHTAFFRERHHFNHLAAVALPELMAKAFAGGRVRIWSAAAATGEEAYSIAAVLLAAARKLGGGSWLDRADIRILGTDIASHAIETARSARYPAESASAFPPDLRGMYDEHDDLITLHGDLRKLVQFQTLNLHGEWPMRGLFDIIFCRNVCIYFDAQTQERLWERLSAQLTPAGWLYLGHSERISGPATRDLRHMRQTIYRRCGDLA